MLRFLRKYSSSTGIKILYAVLALLFVIWGVGAVGGERVDVVARVHGDTISRRALDRQTVLVQKQYEQMLHGKWSPELARSIDLRGQALDQLIEQALIRHEAARLGITVTEAELVDAITRMPELQDGGRFNRGRLEAFLRYQRDQGEFEDELRMSILFQRLHALVTDGVQVSDAEVEERYRLDHEQVNVAFVRVAADEQARAVAPTTQELEDYLAQHGERYREPTRVRARYAAYRPADFLADVQVSNGDVAEYYELHKEESFTDPEQVRARHILVKAGKGGAEAARGAARKKAEDLLARAKAGEDFAALATVNSEDPGSAAKGGDLGLFSRGRMAPAFETAAFALEPGALSEIVETPFGFHIIKVEEHPTGGVRPLDTVRDAIVDTIRKERALELARRQAETDRRKVAHGTPFAEVGRKIEEAPPFEADADVPGIGRVKEFTDAALALGEGQASDLIETDEAIYLLTPFARVDSHVPALEAVTDRVAADLSRERGEAAAKERAEQMLARAKELGLEQAAKEAGVTVEETGPFDRRGAIPKLGALPDLRTDAFALGTDAPLAPRVYTAGGDAVVAALRSRVAADMSGLAETKDTLRQTVLQRKRQALLVAYLDYLKERAHREGAFEVFAQKLGRG
jgi:peptidyl-prolyl cis-trans isomerase D